MSDYNLGTARGTIEIDYNGQGPKQAAQDMRDTGKAAKDSSADLNKAANGAGVAGAVIAGGFALAAKSAGDFEFRMSAVESVSGATATQMDALRDKALQLGADTKYSATESASAMEELVKAGLSVDDVLNGAADATVALAAAGEIALPEAATIASNAMNQFNLGAEDMVNVADKIAGAANASAIDVGDFGQSMSQAGAVANLAGVSFDDTATAIALMGNAGIKGSDAGTSLKSMFMRLQPTTEKQKKTMEELGLLTYDLADANEALAKVTGKDAVGSINEVKGALAEYAEGMGKGAIGTVKNANAVDELLMKYGGLNNAFYDSKGNTQDLSKISGTLAKSLKGMSKEQKQAALNTLFGSDAIRAAAILANNGSKGFDKMSKSMGKVSAADVAATRMDNFKGSVEEMTGSLETLMIVAGTPLLGMLRQVVDGVTWLVEAFLGLPGPVQAAIGIFLAVVGSALLAFAAFVKIVNFLTALKAAFVAVRAVAVPAWLATLGPIALVVAAIAAVIAIIVILWKRSQTFRNIVMGVWNAVKSAWNSVKNFTTSTWSSVVNWISQKLTQMRAAVTGAMSAARNAISNAWNTVKTTTSSMWNAVVKVVANKVTEVVTSAKSIKDKIMGFFGDAKTWLSDKGREIVQGLIDGLLGMLSDLKAAAGRIAGAIGRFLPGSPVKEGPLKVLNNGYAGGQIVKMVADGMEGGIDPVQYSLRSLLAVDGVGSGVDGLVARPEASLVPVGAAPAPAPGQPTGLRIVEGRLTLDESGYVFIAGVAEDVYEHFSDDDSRRSRM